MKEIKAYIRMDRAQDVLIGLESAGVDNLTLTHVLAVGPTIDKDHSLVNMEFGRQMNRMVKLELICDDDQEDLLARVIRKGAFTGHQGDGVIAAAPVERLIKIRTGKPFVPDKRKKAAKAE